ncbi:MAG: uroporphyrinogen decarboxylase family protein [Candidatus Methanoperedens sp.]
MNSMERVIAALQGNMPDRRAFTMTLSLYGAKLTNCPLTEYYTVPELYAKGQIAVVEQCKPDIIFTPFALALEAQAFGSEIVYLPKSPPNVKKPFIRNPEDTGKIKVPDVNSDKSLSYIRNSTRLLVDRFKGKVPICGVLTAPIDLPAIIMGVDNWLEILLFDRQKVSEILSVISRHFTSMANGMFEDGIDFLALPMMFCNPKLVIEKTIKEIIIPELDAIFANVRGPIVFHHGGNPIAGYLDIYRQLPNIGGFVLDPRDDFREARKSAGEKILLLGNLDGPTLGKIKPERAILMAKKILDDRKGDRHFIFATSGADVAWDTPMETITGIYDLIQKY